jgi:hypothetical protein
MARAAGDACTTAVSAFLRSKDADLPSVVATVQKSIGFASADALLAVGSVVEGLSNRKSDLDLILITSRDATDTTSGEVALVVGKCLCHVQIVSLNYLDELSTRFHEWSKSTWDTTYGPRFNLDERTLLHRLIHSDTLFSGPINRLSALLPDRHSLARLKLQVARHVARTIQIDMAGSRDAGDYMTLVFAAEDLLGHAVDALAAGYQLTNPAVKWRSRILEFVTADWEQSLRIRPTGFRAPHLFWALHRAPVRPDRGPALAHALRIATFARAVFVWAERRLVRQPADQQGLYDIARAKPTRRDAPLPYLDFDVDFFESSGRVALGRLNEFSDPLVLSLPEFEVARLFDGVTTAREATRACFGAAPSAAERCIVDNVLSRVVQAGLSVPAPDASDELGFDRPDELSANLAHTRHSDF